MAKAKKTNDNNGLIVAIVFAAIIISASLLFFALQIGGDNDGVNKEELAELIDDGINSYVADAQADYEATNGNGGTPPAPPAKVEGDFSDDDAVLGDPNAPITIVEFSDYECPFCASFFNGAYQQIKSEYVDTGKVKIVFRDFPLSFHQQAYPSALAAECVRDQSDDETYFEMHDMIFLGGASSLSEKTYLSYVNELGLDEDKYTECYESEKFKDEIFADQAAAQSVGIGGTPSFIIGDTVIEGAQEFSVFKAEIDSRL